ncbi:MAG: D-psicose/D-tagatose/L-ribulose 3-epimerase [Bermanella sp.]
MAPTKIWPDCYGASYRAAQDVRRRLEIDGFVVPALQAILFGKADFQVFNQ